MDDADYAALDLKQYAINTLNGLAKEIDDQFSKWSKERVGFVALLCAAHDNAAKSQAAVFKQQEEEARRAFERAMLVFSILGVACIDFIGAAIELRIAPKVIGEYEKTTASLVAGMEIVKVGEKRASADISRKLMGDFSNDLMDIMFALGTKYDGPPSFYKEPNFSKLPYVPNAQAFAQEIFVQLDQQQKAIIKDVYSLSQRINNSTVFGPNLVKKLVDPTKMTSPIEMMAFALLGKVPDRDSMIKAGYLLIDKLLDAKRQKWATDYQYYGYDPPPSPHWHRIEFQLERALWAVWIAQQNLKTRVNIDGDWGWVSSSNSYTLVGASGDIFARSGGFASLIKDSPIVVRLFEVNAPVMHMLSGSTWSHRVDCDGQLDRLTEWAQKIDLSVVQEELKGVKRTLGTVSQIWQN